MVPAVRTTAYGKNSFKYAAPVLWNSLPDHFRTCSSFGQFKTLISTWSGKDCKCIACDSGYIQGRQMKQQRANPESRTALDSLQILRHLFKISLRVLKEVLNGRASSSNSPRIPHFWSSL
ncbi:hypothetical protein DPMN_136549 [Dreissena polymorpha]|uniref:Uncharacterized protein n=1 Tax=Dreissena polymorpha TaxID=45954 RepID=A0A9D4G132_DREPO|nr:hypothetical protein DPMN_136549 [Dreissena polymorpha]